MQPRHQNPAAPNILPRILVVGGGAGGLELVTQLGRKLGRHDKAVINLIDSKLTHLWKPLLHEVAAGTLNPHENEINYFNHAAKNHYHFYLGEVIALDRKNKCLTLATYKNAKQQVIIPEREVAYDILIFAVGSETNDFATPGVNQYCALLENQQQAIQFHQRLLEKLFTVQHQGGEINIAIIGAGATGVELAAELQFTLSHIRYLNFKRIERDKIKLFLIEAGPRILGMLPENIAITTTAELQKIGIKILTGERVQRVTEEGVYTEMGDFIAASIKVWTAGIKAPEFLTKLDGLTTNKINQLIVKQTLQSVDDENIFALGDCAAIPQKNGEALVPALAQAAHQEAKLLTRSLQNYLQQRALLNFYFRYRGSLISLNKYSTIGYLMGRLPGRLMLEGRLARLLYLSLYKIHQITLLGFWRTFITTIANLLTRRIKPRLKLH